MKNVFTRVVKAKIATMLSFVPDEVYIELVYFIKLKKILNIRNATSFNEKIQYKKIYDHNPVYTTLVDKYKVRNYVSDRVGDKYLIPLLGVWDSPMLIDVNELPEAFVLKCNHDSGTAIICEDKTKIDFEDCKRKLNSYLKINYYYKSREWAYKNVKPCILAEKLIRDDKGDLRDYKFFCFGGTVFYIQVDFDRQTNHTRKIYTRNWEPLDVKIEYPISKIEAERPRNLDEMIHIAERLSAGLSDARIDLYSVTNGGQDYVYFGEITLYHGSGLEHIVPETFNTRMGQLIKT
ncbi:TupA-like ATPgrasp [Butyrivibrio sp. ob235]|uniref:ATP-grasp fold amidoligase family protein n=1 Tax=Butyrivibrio sp. ob235 TaxID=1761780 RepID=UPI0008AE1CAA|nr:ATP-grasp fold amidoligase family protein [Butyrivibrio sp. ob235]SEK63627.1 TupA-like ATPgrasp [Butyrivibrio sp. ob235]